MSTAETLVAKPNVTRVSATPAAVELIDKLMAMHGPLMFHQSGGCCDARTPLCLRAGELRLGARDILLGVVEDVPVYEMQSTPEICYCSGVYELDLTAGLPVGFSLDAGDGMRFTIREKACVADDCPPDVLSTTATGVSHDRC